MKRTCSYGCTGWHSNHHVGMLPPAVMRLRQVVDDLVEPTGDKIGKLHFNNGLEPVDGKSETCSKYSRFTQGRIADTILAKFLHESQRSLEDPAIPCNILAHDDEVGIPAHALAHAIGNGIEVSLLRSGR